MTKSPLFEMNEAEEFGPSEIDSFPSEAPQISGVGIVEEDESDEATSAALEELLALVNSGNETELSEDIKKQEEERERYRAEEEKRISEIADRYNKERYEKEQAAKAERQHKEEEQKAETEKSKKENSTLAKAENIAKGAAEKLKGIIAVKPKKQDKPKETEIIEAIPSKEETPVQNETVIAEPEEVSTPSPEEMGSFEDMLSEDMASEVLVEESGELPAIEIPEETEPAPEPEEIKAKQGKAEEKKEGSSSESKGKRSLIGDTLSFIRKKTSSPKKPAKEEARESKSASSDDKEPDWKYIATHDEMTGLLNTRAYAEALKVIPKTAGVVFFDINNLKHTNDNFSHEAGNRLIKGVCGSLKKHFGEKYLYRTGGDEFICLYPKTTKKTPDEIQDAMSLVHADMKELSKKDPEKIVYAVSIGYAIGDGKHEIEDIVKAADAAMYKNKKAYKQAHPELAARPEDKVAAAPNPDMIVPENYDDGLKDEQKQLKNRVRENHTAANGANTRQIVRELQSRAGEVRGILIASPTFDHLFIITDVNAFIDLILSENELIDYSYFYVVYEGGPQYYGADEYFSEVTHLFEEIANGLLAGKFRSEKDVKSVKGINIFKNIYI